MSNNGGLTPPLQIEEPAWDVATACMEAVVYIAVAAVIDTRFQGGSRVTAREVGETLLLVSSRRVAQANFAMQQGNVFNTVDDSVLSLHCTAACMYIHRRLMWITAVGTYPYVTLLKHRPLFSRDASAQSIP